MLRIAGESWQILMQNLSLENHGSNITLVEGIRLKSLVKLSFIAQGDGMLVQALQDLYHHFRSGNFIHEMIGLVV